MLENHKGFEPQQSSQWMMTVCPTIHAFVQIKNKQDNDLMKIETTIFLFYGNSNIK